MSYAALVARLQKGGPVLLDGPMGSELVRRGIRWRKHGLLTDQQTVEQLHREYLAAGAHILRTNTFQLNPRVYRNVFRNARHMQHIGAPGLEDLAQRRHGRLWSWPDARVPKPASSTGWPSPAFWLPSSTATAPTSARHLPLPAPNTPKWPGSWPRPAWIFSCSKV